MRQRESKPFLGVRPINDLSRLYRFCTEGLLLTLL